jgi:hypothetical protein
VAGTLGTAIFWTSVRIGLGSLEWLDFSSIVLFALCGLAGATAGAVRIYVGETRAIVRLLCGLAASAFILVLTTFLLLALNDALDQLASVSSDVVVILIVIGIVLLCIELHVFSWFWPGGRFPLMAFARRSLLTAGIGLAIFVIIAFPYIWRQSGTFGSATLAIIVPAISIVLGLFLLAEVLHWMMRVEGNLNTANTLFERNFLESKHISSQLAVGDSSSDNADYEATSSSVAYQVSNIAAPIKAISSLVGEVTAAQAPVFLRPDARAHYLGSTKQGSSIRLYGRDASSQWVCGDTAGTKWVETVNLSLVGDIGSLPIITPPVL